MGPTLAPLTGGTLACPDPESWLATPFQGGSRSSLSERPFASAGNDPPRIFRSFFLEPWQQYFPLRPRPRGVNVRGVTSHLICNEPG